MARQHHEIVEPRLISEENEISIGRLSTDDWRMTTARVAIFHGPGEPFELMDRPVRQPLEPGECLVEISLASICGSDLHTVEGRRPQPLPSILGHEGVGVVMAIGPGRDPTLLGRRVTWTLADSCGKCLACRDWDLPQKCESLFKYGHAALSDRSGFHGCYSTHIVLQAGTSVFPLADTVSDSMAVSANCALATMVAATEPLPRGGKLAVVQGAGLLGLFGCALLKQRGWQRVVVVDTNASRLALVSAMGGEPAHETAAFQVARGTADAIIEASGRSAVIREGMELVRTGGHYQLVGMVHPDSNLHLTGESIIRKCLTLQGIHNYAPRHLREAVRYLETHGQLLPWDRLVSPPRSLDTLGECFDLASTGAWPRVAIRPTR